MRRKIKNESAVIVIVESEEKTDRMADVNSKKNLRKVYEKHQHNLRAILQTTNATPILRRGGVGYMCSYCPKEFPEPLHLKEHTLAYHIANKTDPTNGYKNSSCMRDYIVKLDITNLTCELCATKISSLEVLLVHLQEEHDITLYNDIKNHILPFKFDTEQLTCCICFNVYDKFISLQEHMHKHYRNYICSVCDTGFVNHSCLKRHENIHLTGMFPCSHCSKVFDNYLKQKSHERYSHTHTDVKNRCGYCKQGFRDHKNKELHMVEVHGVKRAQYKCNACDKSYISKMMLKVHVRRDHLLERRHKCPYCEMTFFSFRDVKIHSVTHTGEKEFECEVCLKAFNRLSTLNAHMRIHKNDRRFKCEHCGMTFVYKCSWKAHMKSKHGTIV